MLFLLCDGRRALLVLLLAGIFPWIPASAVERPAYVVAIHGGAGTILRENMTPDQEREYHEALRVAMQTAAATLESGGTALDAVVAAIVTMEDSPLFNAGKGAVFSNRGINELDASLMSGKTLAAGAVAGVTRIKNPILLARLVMEHSSHVLLAGSGAEAFAAEQGVEMVDPAYFFTQDRWDSLQKAKEKEHEGARPEVKKHGTVGVVVRDKDGNLAAGTSTGGLTNKRFGRVGDSPIVGAGTYADNRSCAVSGTGQGEYFIRLGVARDIAALMEYRGWDLQRACDHVIGEKLTALGGSGGVVALDAKGNVAFAFNTSGMYRGYLKKGAEPVTLIYRD